MTAPQLAVVVATRNRREMVGRLLDALAAQDGIGPFEVVVVDDGSTDGTIDALQERAGQDAPFTLVPLRQGERRGPATARNRGWRSATAPIVCFTDDDCVPQRGWLRAMETAIESGADLVQGRTIPNVDQLDRTAPFSRTIVRESDGGYYETCNMAYRREVLEEVGGFDEDFRFPFGEDTDLAWRAIDGGRKVMFEADALVYHEVWPFDLRAHIYDIRRQEGLVHLVRKHPQLRDLFPMPWCVRERHATAMRAAGALVALVGKPKSIARWGLAASAGQQYYEICRTTRRNPPRRREWPIYLPLMLATDLGEVGVMAIASVKHRTFLL